MKKITKARDLHELLQRSRSKGRTIGFVPTMGALHEGHLSLVRAARRENDVVVVSIFVNKLQFGPKEDFKKYPRPWRRDLALLRGEKVDFVFMPLHEEMYSEGPKLGTVPNLNWGQSPVLCAKYRPGHFEGVATVVAKFFNIVRPDRAYFGAKDYQQVKVIEGLNRDLNFHIKIRMLPTVREKDGLAMSSRNQYLTPEERRRARSLFETLFGVRERLGKGARNLKAVRLSAIQRLKRNVNQVQYFEIVDPETLRPLGKAQSKMVAAAACFVGKTRLIDNVIIRVRG